MKICRILSLALLLLTPATFAAPTSSRYSAPRSSVVHDISGQFGLSISDVTLTNSSSKTGIVAGATIGLFKTGNVVFESGLLYKQMGTTYNEQYINLNYLVLPLAVRYYFIPDTASVALYGKGGLAPGLALTKSVVPKNGGTSQDLQGANTLDLGLILGAGTRIRLSDTIGLLVEANYTRGLGAILDKDAATASINNIGFALTSGVAFSL